MPARPIGISRVDGPRLNGFRKEAVVSADDVTDASGASITAEDLSFRQDELPEDRSLIIVDDDRAFAQRLVRAMELRGFEVRGGHSVAEGIELIRARAPAFAVVDMRLEDGNGLDVIAELSRARPDSRAIVLTGYGNIATAVTAVKLGAVDYLAKPADADDVTDALLAPANDKAPPPENPMSADRVRWEHIQRVYELCNRNVSETARRLNMHRRTLQRILAKRAPK
jgi:two-component system, response regulator RegA